jgi:hypothetical protein
MVRHLDGRRRRDINDFTHARQTDPAQPQMTVRAFSQSMLHNLGRPRSATGTIELGVSFLTRLLLFGFRLFHIGFDERWWGRFQLLQFLNACLADPQLLADFIEPL